MDILSHGLWGGVLLGRKNRKDFWWSIIFGVIPDLLSFGIFTGMVVLGLASGLDWSEGRPSDSSIPQYVNYLYNITHSLIVFFVVFLIVWLIKREPFLPILAWGFHIVLDIFTHSTEFFPTPFLWPFFNSFRVDGIPWIDPIIFVPNLVLLIIFYLWFFIIKPKKGW